jgi:hypothetical protein
MGSSTSNGPTNEGAAEKNAKILWKLKKRRDKQREKKRESTPKNRPNLLSPKFKRNHKYGQTN